MPHMTPKLHPEVSPHLYRMRTGRGWPKRKAASTPPIRDKSPRIVVNGKRTTVAKERKKAGVDFFLYHRRLRIGWDRVRAATTPPGRIGRQNAFTEAAYEMDGKKMSLYKWAC